MRLMDFNTPAFPAAVTYAREVSPSLASYGMTLGEVADLRGFGGRDRAHSRRGTRRPLVGDRVAEMQDAQKVDLTCSLGFIVPFRSTPERIPGTVRPLRGQQRKTPAKRPSKDSRVSELCGGEGHDHGVPSHTSGSAIASLSRQCPIGSIARWA